MSSGAALVKHGYCFGPHASPASDVSTKLVSHGRRLQCVYQIMRRTGVQSVDYSRMIEDLVNNFHV